VTTKNKKPEKRREENRVRCCAITQAVRQWCLAAEPPFRSDFLKFVVDELELEQVLPY
jgi:hypothetical protein